MMGWRNSGGRRKVDASVFRIRLLILAVIMASGFLVIRMRGHLAEPGRYEAAHTDGRRVTPEADLYLPEASYLKFISLGHEGLIADLLMARALVYYGAHYHEREAFSVQRLERLFTTALHLDPANREGFLFAANVLMGRDREAALRILEMGSGYHPGYWKFPELAGFIHFYYLHDAAQAARYYERASALPGRPPYVPSLSGKLYQESGREENALRVLGHFWADAQDKLLKDSFKASMDAIIGKMKRGEYQLTATVEDVLDPVTLVFRKDPGNPHYRELAERETMRVAGVKAGNAVATGFRERLMACVQRDYAVFLLQGRSVALEFIRRSDGALKRDDGGRLLGVLRLNGGGMYPEIAVERGFIEPDPGFRSLPSLRERLAKAGEIAEENRAGIYGFPPPVILARQVKKFIGHLAIVDFRVREVEKKGGMVRLTGDLAYRNRFIVDIRFPEAANEEWLGKRFHVAGFLAVRDHMAVMGVYFPEQLRSVPD